VSVHVLSAVWRHSGSTLGARLVLLALADMASSDGIAWPSQQEIAKMARLSVPSVKRGIATLKEEGEIEIRQAQRGRRRINVYRVMLGQLAIPDYERLPFELDEPFTTEYQSDTQSENDEVSESSLTGDHPVQIAPDTPSLIEPSVEPSEAQSIRNIYDHWRKARRKTRSTYDRMSTARRQKIKARLAEFSEAELLRAIDAVAADPWPDRRLHDDITVIFRSGEQVDRFLEMSDSTSSGKERAESWLRNVGWQYDDEAIWEDLGKYGLEPEERSELAKLAKDLQREHRSAA